jgi:hypothetical protein
VPNHRQPGSAKASLQTPATLQCHSPSALAQSSVRCDAAQHRPPLHPRGRVHEWNAAETGVLLVSLLLLLRNTPPIVIISYGLRCWDPRRHRHWDAFASRPRRQSQRVPARNSNFRILQPIDQPRPCLRETPHLVSVSERRNSHAHEERREACDAQAVSLLSCSCACQRCMNTECCRSP